MIFNHSNWSRLESYFNHLKRFYSFKMTFYHHLNFLNHLLFLDFLLVNLYLSKFHSPQSLDFHSPLMSLLLQDCQKKGFFPTKLTYNDNPWRWLAGEERLLVKYLLKFNKINK